MSKNKLIQRFARSSGLDEQVVNEVILSFFSYFKECMKSEDLYDIRLKGFGVFTPSSRRLKYALKDLENKKAKGLISEKRYEEKKRFINGYFNRKG